MNRELPPAGGGARRTSEQPRRRTAVLGTLLRVLAWTLTFLLALLLSVWLHLDSAPLRSALSALINDSLAGTYRGRIEIVGIDKLGAWGSSARELRVYDERGAPVLILEGIKLGYQPLSLLRALRGAPGAVVKLDHVRVDEADVLLAVDPATGEWTLARALSKPPKARPPTRRAPVMYELAGIELGRIELSLDHPSLGKLQARVDRLRGDATLGGQESDVSLQRFGVRLVAPNGSRLEGTGSLRLLPKGYLAATFHGFLDGVEVDAAGQLEDGVITLRLDVPQAAPEQVRERIAGWPLMVPLALRLEARGPPERLDVRARLRAQHSEVDLVGTAALSPALGAELQVDARALDARAFGSTFPATSVRALGTLRLTTEAAGLAAKLDGHSEATSVAGIDVPAIDFALHSARGEVHADVRWADARGRVEARLTHTPASGLTLSARADDLDLHSLPRLDGVLAGRADLSVDGRLSGPEFSLEVEGAVRRLRAGAVAVERARPRIVAKGRWAALAESHIDATLAADGVSLGALSFHSATWTSRGPWHSPRFEAHLTRAAGASGSAEGVLQLAPAVALRNVRVAWSARSLTVLGTLQRWVPETGELSIDSLQIAGDAGSLQGSVQHAPGRLSAQLEAKGLDLARLARALELDVQRLTGLLSGRADLTTGNDTRGQLALTIENFAVRDLALGKLEARAQLEGTELDANVSTRESPLGELEVAVRAALAGAVLEGASWRRATGEASAKLGNLPLWPLGLAVERKSPVKELDGRVDAALELKRSDPAELPNLFFQAQTRELAFELESAESSDARRRFDDLRVHASASIAGDSGHGVAALAVLDQHGKLVTTSGTVTLDLPSLLAEPEKAVERLLSAPLDALVRLHPRPLSMLPPPLSSEDLTGNVEATLVLRGSLGDPTLELAARGHQLLGSFSDGSRAVDVTSNLYYTPKTGALLGHADVVQAGKRLVSARLQGRMENPLESPDAWRDADLRAAAMLNGVPLELWPAAARNEIEALLYGSIDFAREPGQTEQRAHIELGELRVEGHSLGNGRLTLANGRAGLRARLWLGSRARDLRLELRASSTDAGAATGFEGELSAHDFDAVSLTPLVRGILSRLSGGLYANLKFALRPALNDAWYLGIDGEARLRDGGAHLDVFGLDLREMSAAVRARSTPEYTVLQIDPVNAKARSQRPNFSGDAELWLQGFRVVDGEANVTLDEVPLTLSGASRGIARGQVRGRLERHPDHMALEVKIPELRLRLPSTSGRSLIEMDPNPEIHVLQAAEKTPPPPRDPLHWRMSFELGDDVRVQRADLNVPLTGQPRLEYETDLAPSGTIEALPGGYITLFDQRFSIDRGIVEFVPDDPGNPRVDITASWRAADGTTVYVDITGRAKQASVLTRDDRGLEDVERFYLLTGSPMRADTSGPDLSADTSGGEETGLGQTVALGVNELLRDTLGNVAVSVGTTYDDRASYSASVRLNDKLTFEGSFQPASETNLEQSTNDLTGTLDYRFSRNWSLRTELGTSGGAFDLLWSHRY